MNVWNTYGYVLGGKKGDRSSTAKKYPSEILQKRMIENTLKNYSIEFSKETLLFNATKEGHVRY